MLTSLGQLTILCRNHVYSDLQPYICTQVECDNHRKLYDSQYAWYAHEVQAHGVKKEAPEACVMCGIHLCATDTRNHLSLHLLDAALEIIERPLESQTIVG